VLSESRYLVTSLGVSQSGWWQCLDQSCAATRLRRIGQDHDAFRESAAAHIRRTGHTLEVFRGTQELLTAVACEIPEPPSALHVHLAAKHPGIRLVTGPTGAYPAGWPEWILQDRHDALHADYPDAQDHSHEPKAITA
jgi:hypothetical protein